MDTNIQNIEYLGKIVLYVISNTLATCEPQFMKKLSNTEAELKKCVVYKKKPVNFLFSQFFVVPQNVF